MTGDIFGQLYENHYKDIFKFVYHLMGNGSEAEDITQETFLKLHRALQTSLRHDNLKGWLFRTTANMCFNQLKRRRRYHKVMENYPDHLEPRSINNPAESHYLENEERRLMRRALDQLPVRDRLVLMLYQHDLTYADMARAIGVRKSSFRKILYRAIDKLARTVEKGAKP